MITFEKPSYKHLPFSQRAKIWALKCFGVNKVFNKKLRTHRFLEEAVELCQAGGCAEDEAIRVVKYVFSRPVGAIKQEVGGVMITLGVLCEILDADVYRCFETEIESAYRRIEAIHEKNLTKPDFTKEPSP